MKTKTIKTYQYEELSPKAQEKARDWFRERQGEHYAWVDEALKSLRKLAEYFDGQLKNYEIDPTGDYTPSFADFDMPEMPREEIMRRLALLGDYDDATLKGKGDCKLTGYCMDESAIDGFRVAAFAGASLADCMDSAFATWLEEVQADCADQNSDAQVAENIIANEYEFTAEGSRSVIL